jgi:hypothetical protein
MHGVGGGSLVGEGLAEVDAFYWTEWGPDIVNPRREEQGLIAL